MQLGTGRLQHRLAGLSSGAGAKAWLLIAVSIGGLPATLALSAAGARRPPPLARSLTVTVRALCGADRPLCARSAVDGGAAPPRAPLPGEPALPTPASATTGRTLRVLQMNLCNSGLAACYRGGQSIPEAAATIATTRPDLVTVNEVCRSDAGLALFAAMGQAWPADHVFWAFASAVNGRIGGPDTCSDGDFYGIAILGHVPEGQWNGVGYYHGIYSGPGYPTTSEMRAFVCVHAVDLYDACTTHLSSTNAGIALRQCQDLMAQYLPEIKAVAGQDVATVVSGDFNLRYGGTPDARDCVPRGYSDTNDRSVQHILASPGWRAGRAQIIHLAYTDHAALLGTLSAG
jgi:hypothetical protein